VVFRLPAGLAKGSPSNYEKPYSPIIDRIHHYEVEMEVVTGKSNVVLGH